MDEGSSTYERLVRFIEHEMRMNHIYQPVMIRALLKQRGEASVREIAQALLTEDRSQIEYYEHITQNMVGRVLTASRGITEKNGRTYVLRGFEELSEAETDDLIRRCDEKVAGYLERRTDPWSHRRRTAGYVPGTFRYEVLKRAKFRCELCGVSAEQKALEVDHIIPRNRGGTDDILNLQALCYSCNATKRNRDDTDFRAVSRQYEHREAGCIFCDIPAERVIAENRLCFAMRDAYPVASLHIFTGGGRPAALSLCLLSLTSTRRTCLLIRRLLVCRATRLICLGNRLSHSLFDERLGVVPDIRRETLLVVGEIAPWRRQAVARRTARRFGRPSGAVIPGQ